jgi:hypothetical protein
MSIVENFLMGVNRFGHAQLVIRQSVYIGKTIAPCLHKNSAFVSILFHIFKHFPNLSALFIFIQLGLYRLYMLCRLPTGTNDSARPARILLNFSIFKQSLGWSRYRTSKFGRGSSIAGISDVKSCAFHGRWELISGVLAICLSRIEVATRRVVCRQISKISSK